MTIFQMYEINWSFVIYENGIFHLFFSVPGPSEIFHHNDIGKTSENRLKVAIWVADVQLMSDWWATDERLMSDWWATDECGTLKHVGGHKLLNACTYFSHDKWKTQSYKKITHTGRVHLKVVDNFFPNPTPLKLPQKY